MSHSRIHVIVLAFLLLLTVASIYLDIGILQTRFYSISIISSALYIALAWFIVRHAAAWQDGFLYAMMIGGIVYRIAGLGVGPVASDDMYRYIWDGKVQAAGINPYRYAPDHPRLQTLKSELLPSRINFPEMKTVYPPVAEWVFFAAYKVFGESIIGFKIPVLLAEILTLLLLVVLLRKRGQPPGMVLLYAWCPLPVFQFMMDGHLDALGFPFVVLFLIAWAHDRRPLSSLFLSVAALVKLLPLLFVPLLVRDVRRKQFLLVLCIGMTVIAGAYLPYVLGAGSPFESLQTYSGIWEFNGCAYPLLRWLTGSEIVARSAVYIILVLWVGYLAIQRMELHARVYLATLGFLMLVPTVHPWYFGWLAFLVPLYFRWSGIALISLSVLSNIVGTTFHAGGVWVEPLWLPFAQYGPVILLIVWELTQSKSRTDIKQIDFT